MKQPVAVLALLPLLALSACSNTERVDEARQECTHQATLAWQEDDLMTLEEWSALRDRCYTLSDSAILQEYGS
jgi:hypothetical protein